MRRNKPTRELSVPLPPVRDFDWGGLNDHVVRCAELVEEVKRSGERDFIIQCLPRAFFDQVCEALRDMGHEVLKGRDHLRVLIKEDSDAEAA